MPAARIATWSAVGVLTALGAWLRLWDLERAGLGNLFYASTVRSMGRSFHNFIYAASDPAGTVTVDKPPLALWIQVASTKLLGFDGAALILPMAIAGTVAIPFTFAAMKRSHGTGAGLAAAAVLCLFPESVATARDSTMDALVMALLAGASWLLVVAVESRPRMLLLWAAIMGLVFNVKFFEGFLVLPAAAVYIAVRWGPAWRRRLRTVFAAAVVGAAVSLSWVTFYDLTPASDRPLVLNDPSNSMLGLAFRYNGLDRVFPKDIPVFEPYPGITAAALEALESTKLAFGVGDAGPLRMFEGSNGPLFGVPVLLSLLGVAVASRWHRAWLRASGLYWTLWLLTGLSVFSFSNRAAAHYAEGFAPAVAALAGVSLAETWRARRRWAAFAVPAASVAIAVFGWWSVRDHPAIRDWVRGAAAASAIISVAAVIGAVRFGSARVSRTLALVGALALLGAPAMAAIWITLDAPRGGQITRPNPLVYAVEKPPEIVERSVPAEAVVALPLARGARYAFALDSVNGTGEAVAVTAASVLPIWNEYARGPLLPEGRLAELLSDGSVGYVLLSRGLIAVGFTTDIAATVRAKCVPDRTPGVDARWLLYRCRTP